MVEFRLFYRADTASSEAAVEALKEYHQRNTKKRIVIEYINLKSTPEPEGSKRIVLLPTLAVKVNGSTKHLVQGLFPYATLKETLDGILLSGK
jgi:hypothetical protein